MTQHSDEDLRACSREDLVSLIAQQREEIGRLLAAERSSQRQFERQARIILDEMFQFVALLDVNGTLIDVNRAAADGGGLRLEEILNRPFWEVRWWQVSLETQKKLQEAIRRAASGEFVRYEVDVFGSLGGQEIITIDFSIKPVRNDGGKVILLLPEGRNITEKKRAEGRKTEDGSWELRAWSALVVRSVCTVRSRKLAPADINKT